MSNQVIEQGTTECLRPASDCTVVFTSVANQVRRRARNKPDCEMTSACGPLPFPPHPVLLRECDVELRDHHIPLLDMSLISKRPLEAAVCISCAVVCRSQFDLRCTSDSSFASGSCCGCNPPPIHLHARGPLALSPNASLVMICSSLITSSSFRTFESDCVVLD